MDEYQGQPGKTRWRLPRTILALGVGLLTIWAFNRHYQSVAMHFAARAQIYDQSGQLSADELGRLRQAAHSFNQDFGLVLRVAVNNGPLSPPAVDSRTIYLGLDLARNEAVVVMPPLLAKALDPELAARLSGDFFQPYFAAQAWPQGLLAWTQITLETLNAGK